MKLIKILFMVIVALVITNVTLANRTVDEGVVVANLTRDINELHNQNTILRSQVAASGAIGNLSTKLAEAGFVESTKIVSLSPTSNVASR